MERKENGYVLREKYANLGMPCHTENLIESMPKGIHNKFCQNKKFERRYLLE